MSLARLKRDPSKPRQARELLAPVYGWFMEGFDMRDLKEAKALLEYGKAEAYFRRAFAVARSQQAKSCMARLDELHA